MKTAKYNRLVLILTYLLTISSPFEHRRQRSPE